MLNLKAPLLASFTILLSQCVKNHEVLAENMNKGGEYKIANSDNFDTNYKNREYFDVYSKPIKTLYSQVHWTSHGHMPLPEDIVKRFSGGRLMAITGYEVDQVRKTQSGEEIPVPITWAYNHHYSFFMLNSKKARIVKKKATTESTRAGMNHGAEEHMVAEVFGVDEDDNDGNEIPQVHWFSEGNGGEMRMSYHGYPNGYAQIIESPDTYEFTPMLIDTWNRDMKNSTYLPGPLPSRARLPQDAGYNRLLECPCTDRMNITWGMTYALNNTGKCEADVQNATECFTAVHEAIAAEHYTTKTVADTSLPFGCSGAIDNKGHVEAIWNSATSSFDEAEKPKEVIGVSHGIVNLTVSIDLTSIEDKAVRLKLTGPADKWFGVGFGTDSMCLHMEADECGSGGPYAIIVSGDAVTERKLDFHGPGVVLSKSLTIESNHVENGIRTVQLSRALKGSTDRHYSFDPSKSSIRMIMATGCDLPFAQHCGHGSNEIDLLPVDIPKKVCRAGIQGYVNNQKYNWRNRCAASPYGDLLDQHNPTCHVQTYKGGLVCCPHNIFLLDKDQEIPWKDQPLVYFLKFRFYFEEFKKPSTPQDLPSHQQLIRLYHMTETNAGEYDVVQCEKGTPSSQCVHVITSRLKLRDMMVDCPIHDASLCTGKGSTDSSKTRGVKLIYAHAHCHAGTCLSMDLYNADTGRLLCRVEPIVGQGKKARYDEEKYLANPPCLWGDASEGLPEPELLSLDTTLLAVKRSNNTLPHTGEMASWCMRGIVVPKEARQEPPNALRGKALATEERHSE